MNNAPAPLRVSLKDSVNTRLLRSELKKLKEAAKTALNKGNVLLRPPVRSKRPLMDDGTGGYWSSVGRLDRAISVELWLDHYSGLSSPRLWMGFSSASSGPVLRLAKMAKLAGFSREGNKGDRLLFPRCYHRRLCDRPLPCQESRAGSRPDLFIMSGGTLRGQATFRPLRSHAAV